MSTKLNPNAILDRSITAIKLSNTYVTAPSNSTTNGIALFANASGSAIKDSGLTYKPGDNATIKVLSTNTDKEEDLNIQAYGEIKLTTTNYSGSLVVGESIEMDALTINIGIDGTDDGGINLNGKTTINNNCYATAFYETSDENLKDFSGDVDVDFAKLKEIRKSYFTWKDGNGKTQIGTSAQDVQKVYPELVSEDNKGNLTVDYAKLSIIALSAIDKLDERLLKIEKKINS